MTRLSSVFYFHVSLRKQPTFHEAWPPLVSLWNDDSLSTQMEFLHLSLSHSVDKTSGSLVKCWLFSDAIFMLAKVLSLLWKAQHILLSYVFMIFRAMTSFLNASNSSSCFFFCWCRNMMYSIAAGKDNINIKSQRAKIRKSFLIAQGWWSLPSGLWILFLTCPSGKGSFWGNSHGRSTARQTFKFLINSRGSNAVFQAELTKWNTCNYYYIITITTVNIKMNKAGDIS